MRNKVKIEFITSNRADFYLLENVITAFKKIQDFDVQLTVTGAHLSKSYGYTIDEIEKSDIHVDNIIDVLSNDSINQHLNELVSNTINLFHNHFLSKTPDLLIVLGDRYETMAVVIAAHNLGIPIGHIYGGEYSLGSNDNYYRDIITIQSRLHFVSDRRAFERVSNLIGGSDSIFEIGHLGLENISKIKFIKKETLLDSIGIDTKDYKKICVLSLHPSTNERITPLEQVAFLQDLINSNLDFYFIATAANNDTGGELINNFYRSLNRVSNFVFTPNLGTEKYLNFCKISDVVIGNSSSLMFEVPSLGVLTINLGDRQKGRSRNVKVIDLEYHLNSIIDVLNVNDQITKNNSDIDHPTYQEASKIILDRTFEFVKFVYKWTSDE